MNAFDKLYAQNKLGKYLIVGLDSSLEIVREYVPEDRCHSDRDAVSIFNRIVIEATKDIAAGYKPNEKFYGAFDGGDRALSLTLNHCRTLAPDAFTILDCKDGDVGSSMEGTVKKVKRHGVDAVTLSPFMGQDSLQPALDERELAVFILGRTSNDGAEEIQDELAYKSQEEITSLTGQAPEVLAEAMGWRSILDGQQLCYLVPQYQLIALRVVHRYNSNRNCGLVVGATHPAELGLVRYLAPDLPFLIPGVGAQGGDLEATVAAARDDNKRGFVINSSRGIIFAGKPPDTFKEDEKPGKDWQQAIHDAAKKLHYEITNQLSLV